MIQRTHESTPFEKKKFPVVVILDSVSGPANIGSIFRLADAFNIEKLVLCGTTVDFNSNRLKRTARSTIKSVDFEERDNVLLTCKEYQHLGYSVLALEITLDSESIENVDFSSFKKIALVLGNENSGIEEKVLNKAHKKLHINMFGKNSSMNVAQASGIALFEITKSLQPI